MAATPRLLPAPMGPLVRDRGRGLAVYRNHAGGLSVLVSADGWTTTSGSRNPHGVLTWDRVPPIYLVHLADKLLRAMGA